jgi:hypothetical protein
MSPSAVQGGWKGEHGVYRVALAVGVSDSTSCQVNTELRVRKAGSATVQVVGDFTDRPAHFRPCCTLRDSPALLDLPFEPVNCRYLVLQTQNESVVQSRVRQKERPLTTAPPSLAF